MNKKKKICIFLKSILPQIFQSFKFPVAFLIPNSTSEDRSFVKFRERGDEEKRNERAPKGKRQLDRETAKRKWESNKNEHHQERMGILEKYA